MKNKVLKQYIEEKYNVKIQKIKSKLNKNYYVISRAYTVDLWTTGYELVVNRLFDKLSNIEDYLKEQKEV